MPKEPITIAVSTLWPFEASAQFFAILIEPTDTHARKNLMLAECNRQLRYWIEQYPETRDHIWPLEYSLAPDPKEVDKVHRRAMRIFEQERLLAAEFALACVHEAFVKGYGGVGLELRGEGEKLSPSQLSLQNFSAWALRRQRLLGGKPDDPDKVTAKTFEQRAWAKTKPVLHLAMAVWTEVRGKNSDDGRTAFAAMFDDRRETERLFHRAEWFRHIILDAVHGKFKTKGQDMVRVVSG
jgi:hypothetical protein